ncbi:MAG TPA: inositol monophosphatase family protein, partial [Pseudolysinimonas sp.]|nr:inositol monophosphatase family protein [Pseudolysinimonas sp.]
MSSELRALATSIAIEAGELAARRRREGVEVADTKSSAVDVVTEADREVERLIRSRLADARPNDAILGEEGGGQTGSSGLTWVVDPIDGTTNYLYGIPHYAVSIAVVEGDPDPLTWADVVGVVHNPASGELYSAAIGEGATSDGKPIHVAAPVPLDEALVGTGF